MRPEALLYTCLYDHYRELYPHQIVPGELVSCHVCRSPMFTASPAETARYVARVDRRCNWCKSGLHHQCTGISCYGCPRESHRRHGVSNVGEIPKEDDAASPRPL